MPRLRPPGPPRQTYGPTQAMKDHYDRVTAPCTSRATFEDGVEECAGVAAHVDVGRWHENAAKDHRWSIEVDDDGEPLEGMVKQPLT